MPSSSSHSHSAGGWPSVLLSSVLLASTMAFAQDTSSSSSANNADLQAILALADTAASYNNLHLQGWFSMPGGLRNLSSPATPMIVYDTTSTSDSVDVNQTLQRYQAAVAVFSICIVIAVIAVFFFLPIFYVLRRFGYCGSRYPTRIGYSAKDRSTALSILFLGFVLVFVGFILGYLSTGYLVWSVQQDVFSTDYLLNDVQDIGPKVDEVLSTVVESINGTVDSVFSQVGDIPTSFINTYVPPLVKSITDNIDTVQLGISNLAKQLATVNVLIIQANAVIATLQTDFTQLQTSYNGMAQPTSFQGYQYSVNSYCMKSFPEQELPEIVLPNLSVAVNLVNSINLTSQAVDLEQMAGNATNLIESQTVLALEIAKQQFTPFIASIQASGEQLVNETLSPITDQAAQVQSVLNALVDQYVNPAIVDLSIALHILFAMVWFFVVLAAVGWLLRKSWVLTCGSVVGVIVFGLCWIACAIVYASAVAVGQACVLIDTQTIATVLPPSWQDPSNPNYPTMQFIPLAYAIINECTQSDGSFDNIVIDGVSIGSMLAAIESDLNSNVNADMFVAMIEQLNIPGQVSSSLDVLSSFNASAMSSQLDSVDWESYLSAPVQSTNSSFNDISQEYLMPFGQALGQISTVPVECMVYSPRPPTNTQPSQQDALNRISAIRVLYDRIVQTDIPAVMNSLVTLQAAFNQTVGQIYQLDALLVNVLNATNSDLSTFVLGVDALVGGIVNNTIPSIVGQVKVAVAQAVTQITAAADCTYLGDDFRAVENSMCFYTIHSLDGVWWALGFFAVFLLLIIAGFILSSKRVLPMSYWGDTEVGTPPSRNLLEPRASADGAVSINQSSVDFFIQKDQAMLAAVTDMTLRDLAESSSSDTINTLASSVVSLDDTGTMIVVTPVYDRQPTPVESPPGYYPFTPASATPSSAVAVVVQPQSVDLASQDAPRPPRRSDRPPRYHV